MKIEPVKGSRDFYPDKMRFRNWFFERCRYVAELYGYEEYDGPFLEPFELYARKSGEELVNEQTYRVPGRGEDAESMAIRPEMTPTLARMVAAHQTDLRKPIRWFSIPNCWRYETPQRGRKREFYQFNIDIIGADSLDADAEILAVTVALLKELGLSESEFSIRVSSRAYLESLFVQLGIGEDKHAGLMHQIDRMEKVSRDTFMEGLVALGLSSEQANGLLTLLQQKSPAGFAPLEGLFQRVADYGIAPCIEFDPAIARGLLYYTGSVFEIWDQTGKLRRSVAGGGRYDNLVTALGGAPLSGVGIAFSDVVVEAMLEQAGKLPNPARQLDVYLAVYEAALRPRAVEIAGMLRSAGISASLNLVDTGLNKQLRAAVAEGARCAVIVAPAELERGEVSVKNLQTREQTTVPVGQLAEMIRSQVGT
jgi:histidyl-tRNA synthetase